MRIRNRFGVVASVADGTVLAGDWEVIDPQSPAPGPAEPADVEVGASIEVHADAEAEPVHLEGAPAGNASRAAWAAYAESLGVEPGDLTRDELREATANL